LEITMNTTKNTADRPTTADLKTPDRAPARTAALSPGSTAEFDTSAPGNDNAAHGGIADTTALVARPEVVRAIRATLLRYRVAAQNMADAIADVQVESIETSRTGVMPRGLAQWKALATTIAVRWGLDRLRQARLRGKYDAGLTSDADAYLRPTLHWEHRDPVDTKRYLAILKDLFDSGQMPERGEEILQAVADEVPHEEIAAEIGVATSVVHGRLFRMRAKFRARLAALGMLIFLLLLAALLSPAGEVVFPPRRTPTAALPPPHKNVPACDGGAPCAVENRPVTSKEIAP
jgi:DNA-directed RNA polymerase specialized sigma24 family protein